ncbi:MAG: tRNA lysidine(34) synthetase TilS, partial [Limisphaerales bacterium]
LRDSDFLARATDRSPDQTAFQSLPKAAQRRELHRHLIGLGIEPEFKLIKRLLSHPERCVTAPGGVSLQLGRDGKVEIIPKVSQFRGAELMVPVEEEQGEFSGLKFRAVLGNRRPRRLTGPQEWFDAAKLGVQVCLRHWRAGDRFQPIGMPDPVKLQNLFVNAKIQRNQRRELVVMENEKGQIVWVEGLRIGELAKICSDSSRFWRWEWERLGDE